MNEFLATWIKKSVTRFSPANNFPHLIEGYFFDDVIEWRHFIREHIRIRGGRDQFARQRNNVQSLRDLIEKARMS